MEIQRIPLHAEHEALGAHFVDFAGWRMPLRYTSELAEHRAVRESAGLFDLSHMGEIVISGPQAGEMLDYALVSKLSELQPGRARYTMICRADGGVLDDLIVYRLDDQWPLAGDINSADTTNRYLVVANAANAALVQDELRTRSRSFSATVTDQSTDYALLALQGPLAATIAAGLTDTNLASLKYYRIIFAHVAGKPALIARTGYTGEDGFELFVASADAAIVWHAVLAAGEPYGIAPAGLGSRDSLRLEAGMPLYGNELSTDRTPYHANLGRIVALTKPTDFVGRDALSAVAANKVDQILVGLQTTSRRAPRHGYPVVDAAGAAVGEVTSGALSPTLGYSIAMAYVTAEHAQPGTKLAVDIRGRLEDVEVVALPFYRRASEHGD